MARKKINWFKKLPLMDFFLQHIHTYPGVNTEVSGYLLLGDPMLKSCYNAET